jgi:hypothetical protein
MTRINMILTMVPTAAYKTLVLFEKHGGIIADNLKGPGWSLGWVSAVDPDGEQSGLLTHIATTESVSLCMRVKS